MSKKKTTDIRAELQKMLDFATETRRKAIGLIEKLEPNPTSLELTADETQLLKILPLEAQYTSDTTIMFVTPRLKARSTSIRSG
jgi:hypothetical protein